MARISGHYEWDDDELTPGQRKGGGLHQNLFDGEGKLAPEREQGYAGLAFFPLGYDQGEIVEPMLHWWSRSARPAR